MYSALSLANAQRGFGALEMHLLLSYCNISFNVFFGQHFQHLCTCTNTCVRACAPTHTHTHTHTHTLARSLAHTRTHARPPARTHARTHAHTHIRSLAHTHTHTHTHTRTHTHTHTYTHTRTHIGKTYTNSLSSVQRRIQSRSGGKKRGLEWNSGCIPFINLLRALTHSLVIFCQRACSKRLAQVGSCSRISYSCRQHCAACLLACLDQWLNGLTPSCLRRGTGGDRDPRRWGKRESIYIYISLHCRHQNDSLC